jgi:hypothetical protein
MIVIFITYSMKQNISCKANSRPSCQEIPSFVRYPKVHCRVSKNSPQAPILSQMDPLHIATAL